MTPMASLESLQYLQVEVKPPGYAVVLMKKDPVNTLDTGMWQDLSDCLKLLEQNASVKGLVLASAVPRDVFSAGNDLNELYAPVTSFEKYSNFWILQNRFMANLYKSHLITVAAIKGACPAGGCAISLCCDFRIMTKQGSIGLNEVLLGIPVPKFWADLMGRVVGVATAERLTLNGKFLSPSEALEAKLVDALVATSGDLLPAAEAHLKTLLALPSGARHATKLSSRLQFCKSWESYSCEEPAGAWEFLNKPEVMKVLGAARQRLSKGSSKL